jgi:signal transduction histidine kinase/ligand-binding sensor domain-containing protein
MNKIKILFLFKWHVMIICACFINYAHAQIKFPLNYTLSKLTADDGLSQVSNYFRYEDSRGFMWITANDAINRYDGSSIKVFNLNRYFKNCPNLQQGYGFAEDSQSNIYVGSERGLYIYNRNTDKFTLQKIYTDAPDDIAMPFAFKGDKVWCFNRFYQLATYNVKTREVKLEVKIDIEPINSVNVYQNAKNAFFYRWPFFDKNGKIWIVATNEILVFDKKTNTVSNPFKSNKEMGQNEYFTIAYDGEKDIIHIGSNNGIIHFNNSNGSYKRTISLESHKLDIIYSLAWQKNILAFNSAVGMGFLNLNNTDFEWIRPPNTTSLRANINFSFDKIGRLWTTDNGIGQNIYSFKQKLMQKVPSENEKNIKIKRASVSTMVEFPNKDILFQGDWALNKQKGNYYNPESLKNKSIYGSYNDKYRNGTWLVEVNESDATKGHLSFLDKNNKYTKYLDLNTNFNIVNIQDLLVLDLNKVLISSSNGIFWFHEKQNKFTKALNKTNGFKINLLTKKRIAISYLNSEFIIYDISQNYSLKESKKILPGVQSFYLQEDTLRKQYWVGSNKGVYLLDKDFNIIKLFDANNGLVGTYIYGLLLDSLGNVYCSHQRGISSINATDYAIINYDKADGIQDWDFNNRSFLKASDGTLYFGGVNGVNYFKPPLKPSSYYTPELYIDQIWVNDKIHQPDTNANLLSSLSLPYSENNLVIRAIVKDLEYGKSRQIIYRLRNNQTAWSFLPPDSKILFNSLASGDYVLELGVYDKYTNIKKASKSIKIHIDTPFYNSLLFWLLLSILATGGVFYLYNRRILREQKTEFEKQLALEKQRSKITADLHDDIGSSLSSLQVNSAVAGQLLKKDPAKAQLVLNKIEAQAKKLGENMGDFIWSMKPGKEEFIDLGSKIKNFANDIFGATNIIYDIQVDKNLNQYLKEISLRKNLIFIAREAINNAAKYSKAKNFSMQCSYFNKEIFLEIIDDGIGFEKSNQNGNGLVNMQNRTKELGGIFELETAKNAGCHIRVYIPVV